MSLTVAQLKSEIERLGYKAPSGYKKEDLQLYHQGIIEMIQKQIAPINFDKVNSLSILCSDPAHASSSTQCSRPECLHPTPVKANPELDYITHLYTYGWAIIKVPNIDTKTIREGILDWLHRTCNRFNPGDQTTWVRANIPYNLHGIFKHWVGHIEPIWKAREACHPVFAQLWQTPDLLTSFDGCCLLTPGKHQYKNWIHCDQGRKVRYFANVQGILNLYPNGPADGGTVLMSGSHTRFSEYFDRHPTEGISGFCRVDPLDPCLKGCQIVKPCVEEGELLLFDSRTFHCNMAPLGNNPRICVYVSMQPKVHATQADLQKRQKLAQEIRMTGHWCYGPYMSVCEKMPREMYMRGIPIPSGPEMAQMTPERLRMIGY